MSDDEMSVQQFRQRCVEPMGEESDHVHIVALTDALQARPPRREGLVFSEIPQGPGRMHRQAWDASHCHVTVYLLFQASWWSWRSGLRVQGIL